MATLECVDGPLAGQRVTWRRLPAPGRSVRVAEVDVEHGVLEVEYRVQDGVPATSGAQLRFVAARDVRRPRRGLRRFAGR